MMTQARKAIALAALAASAAGLWDLPAQSAPLQITDAVTAREFHVQGVAPMFSPDGRWVTSTVCDPTKVAVSGDGDGNIATRGAAYRSMGCDIVLNAASGTAARNIGGGNNWGPAWSPDGMAIAFYSDRDGKPGAWLWDLQSGKARKLTEAVTRHRLGFEAPIWTPDGRSVIVKLRPAGADDAPLDVGNIGGTVATDKEPGSTVVLFQSPRQMPVAGARSALADSMQSDLALVDVANGSSRLLIKGVISLVYKISPDGRYLLVLDQKMDDPNQATTFSIVEIATGKVQSRIERVVQSFGGVVSWSPDSRRLVYASIDVPARNARIAKAQSDSLYAPHGADLYLADVETGAAAKIEGAEVNTFANDYLAPVWNAKGDRIYVIDEDKRVWTIDAETRQAKILADDAERDAHIIITNPAGNVAASDGRFIYASIRNNQSRKSGFVKIDTETGKTTVLREDDTVYAHTFSAPALSPDGKQVLYLAESSHESHDLWVSDMTFRDQRRVTTINPQLSQYKFGQSRIIEYKTAEGRALRASVLLPTDYKAGKRYPTMVWVYAGDDQSTRYVNNFGLVPIAAFNMQMLATRGYAVIWPEVPTSRGTPMKDLMKAVMPAIDKLVELGIADGDRLAVMGNSNGGYSTLALIAQTNRFKAAVCNSGFGDLGAFYGTMGGGWIPWLERLGGGMGVPPWEAPMQYVENSPYYQLNRIQTPLMLQAGAADLGIINHSDAVWVGMQRLNKDVTYLRYGGESHVLAAAANLNDYWKRLFAFVDKNLQAKKTAKK